MNGALKKQCTELRALFDKASADEIRTRYRIAVILVSIQDGPNKYGSGAFTELAPALRCDRATLFRYAQVARTLDRKTVESALTACSRAHRTTSWWHLIVIAGVSSEALRAIMLGKLATGISVRELERMAKGHPERSGGGVDTGEPNASVGALRALLTITDNFKGRASVDIHIDIATPEVVDLLGRVIESQEELREICERNVRALREQRSELQRKRIASVVPTERQRTPRLMG